MWMKAKGPTAAEIEADNAKWLELIDEIWDTHWLLPWRRMDGSRRPPPKA